MKVCICWWKESWCYQNSQYNNKKKFFVNSWASSSRAWAVNWVNRVNKISESTASNKWCLSDIFFSWLDSHTRAEAPSLLTFRDHRHTTFGKTPLDQWSARRRGFYLTTQNTPKRHPCPGEIRTRNPSNETAAHPRLRPRGHRDRLSDNLATYTVAPMYNVRTIKQQLYFLEF